MSRIGKQPLTIPSGVTVSVNGRDVLVKGPKGEVPFRLPSGVALEQGEGSLEVKRLSNGKRDRASHGMVRAILGNNVRGVVEPFSRTLEIVGVGYTANVRGATLALKVGYANEIVLDIPAGVTVTTPSAIQIVVAGCSKEMVGEFAARTRRVRKPEPYNGKGIRYAGERIARKAGKSFATGA